MTRRVRHRKRGSTYEVLGEAELQISGTSYRLGDSEPLHGADVFNEGDTLVVYRCEETGKLWLRSPDEFRDGRFEEIKS